MEFGKACVVGAACLSFFLSGCGGGGGSSSDDGIDTPLPPTAPVIEGLIGIEANTRVDADTSDLLSFGGALLTEPQLLPASFILAGYVSYDSGVRNPDNPFDNYAEDPADRFQIPFVSGEQVSLVTFLDGSADSDVTLTLFDATGNELVSASTAAASDVFTASVALPPVQQDGEYQVEVSANPNPPSPIRYVLTKLPNAAASSVALDWPRHEFIPGKAIVSLSESDGDQVSALSQSSGKFERRLANSHWLMAMPDLRMASLASPERETLAWIEELRQHSGVASAVPDYRVSAHTPLDEPLYPEQWHYGLINAPTAWQLAANGGLGAVVAVLDTGLFRDSNGWHPDLADNVVNPLPAGTDFVSGDNNPQDPGNDIGSNVFHGTHVAGTVAASASNQIGGTGVAFNSEILPVRVLGEGGTGSSSDLIDAIVWIGGADSPKADVVNLSLGGLPEIELLQNAITSIVNNGVIVVAAAGNQTSSVRSYPAAAQSVFAVSGVDGAGNIATYSNFGPWVDLAAPGGDGLRDANLDGRADLVISTSASISSDGFFVPDYIGLQGTSMASPHVAGVFALMKSIKPDLDYGTLKAWLEAGALTDPVEGGRSDELGYGVINAAKAVMAAIDNPSITVLSASPSVVSLSSETNPTQVVDLQVFGGFPDTVTIESAIASPDWLDVSLVENPLSLTLMLNTDNLSPDIPARTTLTVNYTSDSARTLKLPVVAELVTDETSRNAGQHFILLVNTVPDENDFFQAEAQVVASAIDGEYQFGFRLDDGVEPKNLNEVSPGTYYLVGGTDLDNDGVICQPGEACAEYPVAGLREMVQVDESTDLTGIRMITGYSRPSISSASRDVLPRPGFEGYRLIDKVLPGNRDSKKVGVNP